MSTFETLIYEKYDRIACLTLDRPQALNVYNIKMRDDLYQALCALRDDPEVAVVVIQGAGDKAFCAGADLSEFLSAPSPIIARQARWERDIWGVFLSLEIPIIAALHGYVLGSGMEIALNCDIRLAADNTRFGLPEVGLGIIPAAGGSQTLPRVIGRARSLDILLNARLVGAEEARQIGLVNRIVPRAALFAEAERLAQKISRFPQSVRLAKTAVWRGLDMSLEAGLAIEKILAARLVH